MKPEQIYLWDWERILLGEVPPAFLLEIVLRIIVVYLILTVAMRILGKRMAAQLTRNELAAMVSLAARSVYRSLHLIAGSSLRLSSLLLWYRSINWCLGCLFAIKNLKR
ncbi:MAG TPA: hypothetical protein VGD40_15065 [Chryseosolibacter sp.]